MKEKYSIRNLERLVEVNRDDKVTVLLPSFDIEISPTDGQSYPRELNSALNEVVEGDISYPHQICSLVVEKVKRALPSLSHVVVRMEAEYIVFRETPVTNYETQEMFNILGQAELREGRVVNMIGAEVTGTTACPCAHEGLVARSRKALRKKDFSEEQISSILSTVPIASHNQRNSSQLMIEVSPQEKVNIEDIIEVLEESMSSRLYEVLKRGDEVEVVHQAHLNPYFAEDTVRKIILNAMARFNLSEDSAIFVKSESYESIHQHNAMAECSTTVGELKRGQEY